MSRPSKRPRLHLLPSVSPDPDGELATARARNDDLLKNRWEHIFARYERNFDGVGDEISMLDDTIVVDNGHIKSMRNARDTGANGFVEHSSESPSKYDGRQLLRAMTVGPSENSDESLSDNDADEVLNSIETLADNIITNDESSEDDLFDVYSDTDTIPHSKSGKPGRKYEHDDPDVKYESDFDSLFDNRPIMRSPSVDDLFQTTSSTEPPANIASASCWNRRTHETTETPDTSLGSLAPRETIDREFIREEIRKAIEEENQIQESKIDPAWRIPVRLTSATTSKPVTLAPPPTMQEPETEMSDDGSDDHEDDSVWKVASRIRRSKREVAAERSLKRLRAESEDPLQDGFTSDIEQPPETMPDSDKPSQSRPTSRSSRVSLPDPEPEPSPSPQQLPATTSTDQVRKNRASRSGSPPQIQPTKDESQTKALPKPKKKSKSNSSNIVVQVPTVPRTAAKKRSKG